MGRIVPHIETASLGGGQGGATGEGGSGPAFSVHSHSPLAIIASSSHANLIDNEINSTLGRKRSFFVWTLDLFAIFRPLSRSRPVFF